MTAVSISRDALEKAIADLDRMLTGGNHIASQLVGRVGADFPERFPPDMEHESVLRMLGATVEYDMWCCWSAAMRSRDSLAPLRALTAETQIPGREEIAATIYDHWARRAYGGAKPIPFDEMPDDYCGHWLDCADAVLSLLPAQAEEWRTMDSAPKDKRILVRNKDGVHLVSWQSELEKAPPPFLQRPADYVPEISRPEGWRPTCWNPALGWSWVRGADCIEADAWLPPPDLKAKDTVTK